MKITPPFVASFFFLFLLLFAFTSSTAEYVYDTDGEPLKNGGQYYLLPPSVIGGPVITTAITKHPSGFCSLAVVQVSSSSHSTNTWSIVIGTPLDVPYISTDNPLIISFTNFTISRCTDSSNWVVTNLLPIGQPVMVGDAREFPEAIVKGWFYIKPYEKEGVTGSGSFKFSFCDSAAACGGIGVRTDSEGNSRLVIKLRKPLEFKFRKAN